MAPKAGFQGRSGFRRLSPGGITVTLPLGPVTMRVPSGWVTIRVPFGNVLTEGVSLAAGGWPGRRPGGFGFGLGLDGGFWGEDPGFGLSLRRLFRSASCVVEGGRPDCSFVGLLVSGFSADCFEVAAR